MTNEYRPEFHDRIREATEALTLAEHQLEVVLHALEVVERADKKMMSQSLRLALEKVSAARLHLDVVLKQG